MHTVDEVAPTVMEYIPAGQPVHDALPLAFLNVPATHAVQAPPSGPVYPVLHLQSEIVFADVENGDDVAAGHDRQTAGFALVIFTSYTTNVTSSQTFVSVSSLFLMNMYLPRITRVHNIVYVEGG